MDFYGCASKAVYIAKYLVASSVATVCIVIIFAGITGSYNTVSLGGPFIEITLLVGVLVLLACSEGFQVGILGIEHYCNKVIEDNGSIRAAKIHRLMFTSNGSKLRQLLIGQSFLVVMCSFTIANLTTFTYFPEIKGVSTTVMDLFVRSGFPGAFITICCAQLVPSMLSKEYPIEFLNMYGVYSMIRLALFIEKSGIVQFVYFLTQIVDRLWDPRNSIRCPTICAEFASNYFSRTKKMETSSNVDGVSKNTNSKDKNHLQLLQLEDEEESWPSDSNTPHNKHLNHTNMRNHSMEVLSVDQESSIRLSFLIERVKYFFSTALALCCLVFVVMCISLGYSTFRASVLAQFVITGCALFVVFYCEGLKVAIVSTSHLDKNSKEFSIYPDAARIHELLAQRPDGIKRFLLGRQLIVVPLGFTVAQITNFGRFPVDNFPTALYFLTVNLGLPGMLILLLFAQLTPQLAAEANSLRFLSKKGVYTLTYAALCVEKIGLTTFAWVMYTVIDRFCCRKNGKTSPPPNEMDMKEDTRTIDLPDEEEEGDSIMPLPSSFSILTDINRDEIEDDFRSTSTTGTVINPYIIKTPTYSV